MYLTSVRYRHTSLSIVTHAGLSVWQTVICLHAYANGACSYIYAVLSYTVISKYVQYTSVRYIAPTTGKEIKVMKILIFQSKRHHKQAQLYALMHIKSW